MATGTVGKSGKMSWLLVAVVSFFVNFDFTSSCKDDCTLQPHLRCQLEWWNYDCPFQTFERPANVWPAVPRELKVEHHRNTLKGVSLNISWYPPYDASVLLLEGFEVSLVYGGDRIGYQECFRLDMGEANWTVNDSLQKFHLDCVHDVEDEVTIRVYSLPRMRCKSEDCQPTPPTPPSFHFRPPPPPIPTTPKAVFSNKQDIPPPSSWVSHIEYKTDPQKQIIWIQYRTAPPIYNFTTYHIRLTNITIRNNRDKVYERFLNATVNSTTFTSIAPGIYEVAVEPYDQNRGWECHCVCKKTFKSCKEQQGTCEESGCTTTIKHVTMNASEAVLPSLSKESDPENQAVIIGATLGAIVLVVTLTVVAFLLQRRWTKKYHDSGNGRGETDPILPDSSGLSRKCVFVIISCGDERHQRVAGWFCLFLSGCSCDVKYNLKYNSMYSPSFHRDLQQADKIIIINSKDAFEKFRGCMTNNNEEEDKFTASIKMMRDMWRNDRNTINKTAVVKFPYTEDRYVIKELLIEGVDNFRLMTEIGKLLCFIHDVEKLPPDLESVIESEGKDVDDAAESYPSADSGVDFPPEFEAPRGPDTATVTSTDIMDILDTINRSERTTLSFDSEHQQRMYALNALKDDINSINIEQSMALLNQSQGDQVTVNSDMPSFILNMQPPKVTGKHKLKGSVGRQKFTPV